jgi:hypothetical protein
MGCLLDRQEQGGPDRALEEDTMGDLTHVARPPRRAVRRTARASIALILMALPVAACGSSPSPSAGGSTTYASEVAYSACMRSHGVPNFPDPTSNGPVLKADPQQLAVSTAQYRRAQQACQHLLPNTGSTQEQQPETQCMTSGTCSRAVVQKWMTGLRTLAECLRSHGVPSWPDPVLTSPGLPHFAYDRAGIDHHSASILAKVKTCVRLTRFQGLPLP